MYLAAMCRVSEIRLPAVCTAVLLLICSFQTVYPSDFVANRPKGVDAEAGDPISMSTGSYSFDMPLLNLGGTLPLNAKLSYYTTESALESDPLNCKGVYFSFNHRLSKWGSGGTPIVEIYLGHRGETPRFSKVSGKWINASYSNPSREYKLEETSGYYYLMDGDDYVVFVFEKINLSQDPADGRIKWITDRNGNRLSYTYASADSVIPDAVFENDGGADARKFQVKTQVIGGKTLPVSLIERIYNGGTEQDGRSVGLEFNDSGFLVSVTDTDGKKTEFDWTGFNYDGSLIGVTHPKGNTPYTQTYKRTEPTASSSTKSVVTSQTDAYGNKTMFDYAKGDGFDPLATATETRPDGTAVKYRHTAEYRPPTSITDASGKTVNFVVSLFNNSIASVTDRLGGVTGFAYDTSGSRKLLSVTNAAGKKMSYTYTAQDTTFTNPANNETVTFTFRNLTKVSYPDNTADQFTYNAKGNMLTRIDRTGKTWQYEYDAAGNVVKITNPEGGVITDEYNADNTLKSRKDSDIGITAYDYDAHRRPVKIVRPDGKSVQIAYRDNDKIATITDEMGRTYTYTYDDNGNLTHITDPKGNQNQYAYDLMDRVEKITNRSGNVRTAAYDTMGRLASVTDPNNLKAEFGYEPRGWLNSIKSGGSEWKLNYDDEGVLSSSVTPLGYTTLYQTDALGRVIKITDPLNQSANIVRDSMGRITQSEDPLNRKTDYAYNGKGNLSGITLPVVGKVNYTRNNLGRITQITDFGGQNWKFDYSAMGRLKSVTDPLNNARQFTRDNRGRISQTSYPGNATATMSFDDAGNITRKLYSGAAGPDLQFTYNASNKMLTANNLVLSRDEQNRIVSSEDGSTKFEALYDAGGRLKTARYNNNAFAVTYAYDSVTGLLNSVKDNLTNTSIGFTYDADKHLTGITRSNGVNATFTYNNAGGLTRIQDGSVIDLKYTLDAAGQIIKAETTVPLEVEPLLQTGSSGFAYDAASQVSTAGYSYDVRGRKTASPGQTYSWDGASRLIKIGDVSLAYNGIDDLITRTQGGTTTRYFYHHALSLSHIVAEKDDTANKFQRYYVWTPNGKLLYMIDAANANKAYFYHFDHAGSTLALTDISGAVTDSYAYLPYGKLLKHEGTNPQPFTFIGKWGVRQEGGLYQMKLRYYDPATARFLSRDRLWPRIRVAKELNPYLYAKNNPTGWIDPTGLAGDWLNDPWLNNPLSVALARRAWAERLASQVTDTAGDTGGFTGDRETTPTNTQDDDKWDKLQDRGIDAAKGKVEDAITEEVEDKLAEKGTEKLVKVIGKKATEELLEKGAKILGPAGVAIEGLTSALEIGKWESMNAEEFGNAMAETDSYQLVDLAAQFDYTRPVVEGVGTVVEAVVSSDITNDAVIGIGTGVQKVAEGVDAVNNTVFDAAGSAMSWLFD